MFSGCTNLTELLPIFIKDQVSKNSMKHMFSGCSALTEVGKDKIIFFKTS
jgi:hypothetical protein